MIFEHVRNKFLTYLRKSEMLLTSAPSSLIMLYILSGFVLVYKAFVFVTGRLGMIWFAVIGEFIYFKGILLG